MKPALHLGTNRARHISTTQYQGSLFSKGGTAKDQQRAAFENHHLTSVSLILTPKVSLVLSNQYQGSLFSKGGTAKDLQCALAFGLWVVLLVVGTLLVLIFQAVSSLFVLAVQS